MKIDHIGIAYKDIGKMANFLEHILGLTPLEPSVDMIQRVNTLPFDGDRYQIHLIEPIGKETPISNFLEKRGDGLHHIAFEVEDVEEKVEELRNKGVEIVCEPVVGIDNRKLAFVNPKSACDVLIELIEKK